MVGVVLGAGKIIVEVRIVGFREDVIGQGTNLPPTSKERMEHAWRLNLRERAEQLLCLPHASQWGFG